MAQRGQPLWCWCGPMCHVLGCLLMSWLPLKADVVVPNRPDVGAAGVSLWHDVGAVAISWGGTPHLGGLRRRGLQGMGEVDGRLHGAGMVTYDHLSECMLMVVDEEADLVLFTGDANA